MLGRFMPQEGKFFDLLNAHAERIVEGNRELAAMIGTFDSAPRPGARLPCSLPPCSVSRYPRPKPSLARSSAPAQRITYPRYAGESRAIMWARVLTIPCAAFIAGMAWWTAHLLSAA